MSILKLLCVASIFLPSLIKGQAAHLKHFFIVFKSLLGLEVGGGIFALISFCLIFGGLLYATRGGKGNISHNLGSCIIVLQCFLTMSVIEGNLGSKFITKTGRFEFEFFTTFFRASSLGIFSSFFYGSIYASWFIIP